MSNDIGEAVGSILAIGFGGVILLKLAPVLNSGGPINLAAWGIIYLVAAIVATIFLAYAAITAVASR